MVALWVGGTWQVESVHLPPAAELLGCLEAIGDRGETGAQPRLLFREEGGKEGGEDLGGG